VEDGRVGAESVVSLGWWGEALGARGGEHAQCQGETDAEEGEDVHYGWM
jgi:hypothetical protein